ncbi:60S acidic ribosomal protein P1-like isoform X2 [Echinops telfairi]|uniref:60S acidic ribosomal protein P1-like isoform X2 n=1 Tax=Echinops telfairi TaxID=9371 RepID=A0ABM0ZRK9_ECHTE|nr:60S acidic ribosomal protein P1-like isoform X2 [Echinops telfairi]
MASVSELAGIYSALILRDDEVTITALAYVNIGSLICNVGAGGGPAPSTAAAPAEEKNVEAKEEEAGESDDGVGFGRFD